MTPKRDARREEFLESIVDYFKTHKLYDELTKEEAVREVVTLLLSDIGAAQGFLHAIGVDYDLYERT